METKSIFVGFTVPPSLEDIQDIAENIIDEMPQGLQKYVGKKLSIIVEDFPDAFIEAELELESPFDLLGCYQSASPVAIGRTRDSKKGKDTLYLYRRPILDTWADEGEDLSTLINRVILQEIGHHFGFTPEEIEMYEEDMLGATALDISAG